jgi:hypothetical protein
MRPAVLAAAILDAACAGSALPTRPPATVFDVAAGCSLNRNPNGVWQYGYTVGQALRSSAFRRDGFHDGKSPIGYWQPSSTPGSGRFPYVVCNPSAKTEVIGQVGTARGWAVRAGQVAMEASNDGRYSVVRFTAPAPGSYRVAARFEGIHFGLSTTDVHVVHGSTVLFSAEVDGYAGDRAFQPVTDQRGCDVGARGANPSAAYVGVVKLRIGDTIDFAVGYGGNRTHYCDTTGLTARIEVVGT